VTTAHWPVPVAQNFYQFSYRIVEGGDQTRHSIKSLQEAVRVAGEHVKDVVWTGWSMFHQFTRPAIAPRVVIDTATGEEIEAIETNLVGETLLEATVPEIWRITADGRATLVRPYREDRTIVPHLTSRGLTPGKYLSPRTLIRELYELATHAKEFAKAFPHAERIEFRCSWFGLRGRKIADFNPGVDWDDRTCHVNERTVAITASVDELTADTALVVERLAAPILILFDGLELPRKWIVREVPNFRSL
jgi:hypothetical protein